MVRSTLGRAVAGLIWIVGAQLLLPPLSFVQSWTERDLTERDFRGLSAQANPSDALSAIRERGYLRVAVKNNRPPLGFVNETGELVGFEIEIARQLATDLLGSAEAIKLVPVSNVNRLSAVMDGEVDVAIAAITLTEPRRRLVNFSDPYYLDGVAFVVRPTGSSSLEPRRLEDLRQAKIAILNRSSSVPHVQYLLPGAELVGVTSYQEGQLLLQAGKVDAFSGDASVLSGWIRAGEPLANYQLLPNIISAEPLAIAFPKGTRYDRLRTETNRSVRRWYSEEWLQEQAEYWGLPSGILPSLWRSDPSTESSTASSAEQLNE